MPSYWVQGSILYYVGFVLSRRQHGHIVGRTGVFQPPIAGTISSVYSVLYYSTHPNTILFPSVLCPRTRGALPQNWVRDCITCSNSSTFYIPPELARLSGLYLFVKPFYPIAGYPFNGVGMNSTCGIYIGCAFTMHVFHSITK